MIQFPANTPTEIADTFKYTGKLDTLMLKLYPVDKLFKKNEGVLGLPRTFKALIAIPNYVFLI